jgi:succinate dehydrogenase flavin-adding protein (antitoxin of CptAB toxin-antitoxin module)
MIITVIGRDNGNQGYESVLIYDCKVRDLEHDTVLRAFIRNRENDLGKMSKAEKDNLEVLFAFEGNINTVADWRE